MIKTKMFMHITSIDVYMQSFRDCWDDDGNLIDNNLLAAKAGYWIESYATKLKNPKTHF